MTPPGTPNLNSPGYLFFKDAAHTAPLLNSGNTSCGSGTAITGTGSGAAQTQTIYGLVYGTVPGDTTTTAAGNYTDTATVTLTF
jgi:spore coat protein U-like protein